MRTSGSPWLIRARVRAIVKEATAGQETFFVHDAYLRWLETQEHGGPQPARHEHDRIRSGWLRRQALLYARRAPGNACLTGLRHEYVPYPDTELDGRPGPVNSDSKGCGSVMRSAPFGLTDFTPDRAFTVAANCARMTHGHPTGYYAAGAFAALITHLRRGRSLAQATLTVLDHLAGHRGSDEVIVALTTACDLAEKGRPTAEKVELLGASWVAEESLAIAVYCALAGDSVRESLLLAVNHSGDSDSTAAICGNLLGAHHGDVALPTDWLAVVEGRGLVGEIADDLDTRFHSDDDPRRLWTGPARERYDG
ncbi:ADP-ribosylglycohydrolase family protein [Streptomyces sp. NPDC048404]|uniref:ADP-ribosylglycohydrolase family protein n=1 Tax=unclassified Streptomyces TaxID=2593676 RepID=UPI00342CCC99